MSTITNVVDLYTHLDNKDEEIKEQLLCESKIQWLKLIIRYISKYNQNKYKEIVYHSTLNNKGRYYTEYNFNKKYIFNDVHYDEKNCDDTQQIKIHTEVQTEIQTEIQTEVQTEVQTKIQVTIPNNFFLVLGIPLNNVTFFHYLVFDEDIFLKLNSTYVQYDEKTFTDLLNFINFKFYLSVEIIYNWCKSQNHYYTTLHKYYTPINYYYIIKNDSIPIKILIISPNEYATFVYEYNKYTEIYDKFLGIYNISIYNNLGVLLYGIEITDKNIEDTLKVLIFDNFDSNIYEKFKIISNILKSPNCINNLNLLEIITGLKYDFNYNINILELNTDTFTHITPNKIITDTDYNELELFKYIFTNLDPDFIEKYIKPTYFSESFDAYNSKYTELEDQYEKLKEQYSIASK
jgi:hypothetical protein